MIITLWLLAGFLSACVIYYWMEYEPKHPIEITVATVIWFVVAMIAGPMAVVLALSMAIVEFWNAETLEKFFNFKLFTFNKQKDDE